MAHCYEEKWLLRVDDILATSQSGTIILGISFS
jgi:hypothetical protein